MEQADTARAASAIFATKEAFGKAVGTGLTKDLWWDDLEVTDTQTLRPRLALSASGIDVIERLHGRQSNLKIHLSISARETWCAAFCLIEMI